MWLITCPQVVRAIPAFRLMIMVNPTAIDIYCVSRRPVLHWGHIVFSFEVFSKQKAFHLKNNQLFPGIQLNASLFIC